MKARLFGFYNIIWTASAAEHAAGWKYVNGVSATQAWRDLFEAEVIFSS